MGDWLGMSAAALGRGIEAGEIDPVALTDAFLQAMAGHQFTDRIYARDTAARARDEAGAAADRARRGLRRGPLDGVPISWKDLYDTAGVATESGSALLKGRVPERDAEVLRTATLNGLVCLGKTHQTELAFSGLGLNPVTATPPCVNDHDAVAGGSSSGAATSVAFGLAAAGIGSDTGGSVRIPAVWNDLVGLKTTHGLLSLKGVVPLAARFDTVGPLTRTVEDAALLLQAMGGPGTDLEGVSMKGARLMVLETLALEDVREGPLAAFEDAVARLEAAGAVVERKALPWLHDMAPLLGPLFAGEAYGTWRDAIEAAPDKMFGPVRERFRGGAAFSAADYVQAWHALDAFRAKWDAAVAGYDAVVMPTCPILPPNAQRLMEDDAFFTTENLMTLRNTRLGNMMGVCALTLPTGTPSAGIMAFCPGGADSRLLRLGAAMEMALG